MKPYLPLLLLPFGSILFAIVWLCRRAGEPIDREIDQRIQPPRQIFTGHDEALEARARVRREIADSIRKRSALVASGSSSASVLKMAKRQA